MWIERTLTEFGDFNFGVLVGAEFTDSLRECNAME